MISNSALCTLLRFLLHQFYLTMHDHSWQVFQVPRGIDLITNSMQKQGRFQQVINYTDEMCAHFWLRCDGNEAAVDWEVQHSSMSQSHQDTGSSLPSPLSWVVLLGGGDSIVSMGRWPTAFSFVFFGRWRSCPWCSLLSNTSEEWLICRLSKKCIYI